MKLLDTEAPGRRGACWRMLRRLLRTHDGVSAVEFALLAPVLVVGSLSTVDAGRAVYQKMTIEQALRAGAQLAIAGKGESAIRNALEMVAGENFPSMMAPPAAMRLPSGLAAIAAAPEIPSRKSTARRSAALDRPRRSSGG